MRDSSATEYSDLLEIFIWGGFLYLVSVVVMRRTSSGMFPARVFHVEHSGCGQGAGDETRAQYDRSPEIGCTTPLVSIGTVEPGNNTAGEVT